MPVWQIAQDVMKEMTETLGVNSQEYKTINVKGIIKKFLIGFSNYVIFGVNSEKDIPTISDGTILTLAIDEYFDTLFELYTNPLHNLTNGLWTKSGITQTQRRVQWLEKEI